MAVELITFFSYFLIIILITFLTYQKQKSDTQFVLGNRSLGPWLTALSAQASDMSSWLFMAYPSSIFLVGVFNIWAGIGLTVMMFLNWKFVAPKIRTATEQLNCLTLNAYFEKRFKDNSGLIRSVASIMSLIFFMFYVSSGLVAMGFLIESLFGLPYIIGITLGLLIISFYVFLGGYSTVAWIDLIQGMFLLGVILFIPIYLIIKIGGFSTISMNLQSQSLTTSLFPDFSFKTIINIFLISCGWGLGYFGQPHIITKFMGIKNVEEITKAKYIGISWQILTIAAASLIGLIGISIFPHGISNPELITLAIVKKTLIPFFSGLVLCAILAATTNVMAAQILVIASSLSEDFYKRFIKKNASHKKLLFISRISVIIIALSSYLIALLQKNPSIYKLVFYAWSGLGASFGPLLLLSLYEKRINKNGAFAGILVGGVVSGLWPWFNKTYSIDIPAMIPGFILSMFAIYILSFLTKKRSFTS